MVKVTNFYYDSKNVFDESYSSSFSVTINDFDNDGDLDFVTNNMESEVTLYESLANDQSLGNYIKIVLKGQKGNLSAIGAKVSLVHSLQYPKTQPTGCEPAIVRCTAPFIGTSHT